MIKKGQINHNHTHQDLLKAGLSYLEGGLNLIPINAQKTPADPPLPYQKWKRYQTERVTKAALKNWINTPGVKDLAMVCGKVSGGLTILDFDEPGFYERWKAMVGGIAQTLPTQQTGSGDGYQVAFRSDLSIRNDKLAHVPADSEDGRVTAIETRGEGGYAVIAPSFCPEATKRGEKHRQPYKVIQGDFAKIPTLSNEQASFLLNVARSLDEMPLSKKKMQAAPLSPNRDGDNASSSVIGKFNETHDIANILERNGYSRCGNRFLAPDSTTGLPGVHIFENGRCYSHHGNCPLNDGYSHDAFSAFYILEHGGNMKAAIKAAAEILGIYGRSSHTEKSRISYAHDIEHRERFLPLLPSFPLDVFPEKYQKVVLEVTEAFTVPIEIPASTLLSMGGACIGRTRGILIKRGWIEHANLWVAIVGQSGIGKSPAVRAIYRPVFSAEEKWFAEYREAYEVYKLQMENRRITPKKERNQLSPPPVPPRWSQLFVDDTTTEALTDALAANPRGILWTRDELSGLILELDKYTGKDGGTKSRLMSSYDSGPWKVNRRDASKKAYIPNATLSIFGTVQPKALPIIFSSIDAAIGFLPRFIFINANREVPPLWTDLTVSEEVNRELDQLVESLLAFDFAEGIPKIVEVSQEAKEVYQAWFNEKAMAPWRHNEVELYEVVLAKLRGQCLRIALILHSLEAVANRRSEMLHMDPEIMSKAIRLADYLEAHQKNAWNTIISEEKAVELSPLQKKFIAAIINLESEISSGMLPTAIVTKKINKGLDVKFQVPIETVGKVATSLDLVTRHLPEGKARGIVVEQSDLDKFKKLFRTVPTVRSVRSLENIAGSRNEPNVSQPSEVSLNQCKHEQFGHLPDRQVVAGKIQEIKQSDSSDSSDGYLENENQTTSCLKKEDEQWRELEV